MVWLFNYIIKYICLTTSIEFINPEYIHATESITLPYLCSGWVCGHQGWVTVLGEGVLRVMHHAVIVVLYTKRVHF